MSPTWLPPLNSHTEYITALRIEEAEIPQFCTCREFYDCKEGKDDGEETLYLPIQVKFTVRFFPVNYEKFEKFVNTDDNIPFPALLLDQWFEIEIESDRRGELLRDCEIVKKLFKSMLEYLNISWELYPIRVLEEVDYILEDESGLIQKIMSAVAAKDTNLTETALCLHIFKHVSISIDEYSSWITWILEKTDADPNFREEYLEAIKRPRTMNEIFSEDEMQNFKSVSELIIRKLEDTQNFAFDWKENCTICLDSCVEPVAKLPCSHDFHTRCIIEWLRQNHTCPFCRYALPKSFDDNDKKEDRVV